MRDVIPYASTPGPRPPAPVMGIAAVTFAAASVLSALLNAGGGALPASVRVFLRAGGTGGNTWGAVAVIWWCLALPLGLVGLGQLRTDRILSSVALALCLGVVALPLILNFLV